MDLTGISSLKVLYSFDEEAGTVTMTFKDQAETTTYGTITVDTVRHRGFTETLNTVAKSYQPDGDDTVLRHRLLLDKNNNEATVYLP